MTTAPKIFCIGFHKTGTTSLALALKSLGYTVTGPNGIRDPHIATNALPMALKLVPQYDAFQDNPWPILYKELDQHFPNSKFILTLRDPDAWLKSQLKYFGNKHSPMRQWIYGQGCPQGHETTYLHRYQQHNADVAAHFQNRPHDLLTLNLTAGDGWNKLCPFLNHPIPNLPFPHANQSATERTKAHPGLLRNIKYWLQSLRQRLQK